MTILRLNGTTSGYAEVAAPAAAGNNRLTLPTANGSNGQRLTADGTGATSWSDGIVRQTAQASTSGTVIDFTGIPSWAKRITVMLSGVSTSGTSFVQIQIGTSSGFVTSGYLASATGLVGSALTTANATAGFQTEAGGLLGAATSVRHGSTSIVNITGNTWIANGVYGNSNTTLSSLHGGSLALGGTLDRVRVTTVNGTDTFDAGNINIMYEG